MLLSRAVAKKALKTLLDNGVDPRGVTGAHYFENGEIHSTPAIVQKDIDEFGIPDFSDYELQAYYAPAPVVPLLLTRAAAIGVNVVPSVSTISRLVTAIGSALWTMSSKSSLHWSIRVFGISISSTRSWHQGIC